MEIVEMKERRKALETRILEIVREFEELTGTTVRRVDVQRMDVEYFGVGKLSSVERVTVEVIL